MSGWVAARAGGTMQNVGTSDAQLGYHALRPRFGASPTNRGRLHLEGLAQMSGIETPCVETTWRRNHHGYGYAMRRRRTPRHVLAHRLAWEEAFGLIPAGMHVLHRCDNPPCINPAHLFLGTNADNIADKVSKGRSLLNRPRGSGIAQARLTEAMVVEMRHLNGVGVSKHELARRFGVARSTTIDAVNGSQWSHVPAHDPQRCGRCAEVRHDA